MGGGDEGRSRASQREKGEPSWTLAHFKGKLAGNDPVGENWGKTVVAQS